MMQTIPTLSKPTLVSVLIKTAWSFAAIYFVLLIWYGRNDLASAVMLFMPLGFAQAARYELKLNNMRNAVGNAWLAAGTIIVTVAIELFDHTPIGRAFAHWIEYKVLLPLIG